MIDLGAHIDEIVGRLTDGGVAAVSALADLNPPGVLVSSPAIAWRFGKGATLTWILTAAVADAGTTPAIAALSKLLDQVQTALGGLVVAGEPWDLLTTDGASLPAYQLTFTTGVRAV